MKYTALLLFLLPFAIHANEKEIKSKIKEVIVYQQGAQINRQASYNVSRGVTELVISGISSQINPSTIQIKSTGSIVVLDSKHSVHYPEPMTNQTVTSLPSHLVKRLAQIKDSIQDVNYELTQTQNEISVLNSQKRIIENNGIIKGEGKVNDSLPLLREALVLYKEEMNTINRELLTLNRKQNKLNVLLNKLNTHQNEINNYNYHQNPTIQLSPIHEIRITVSTKESTSGRINVSYLVNQAGWTPLYDLRSNSTRNTVDLTYKAQVYQNTGIDWTNIKLNLSTNNPYTNKTKPNLSPLLLGYTPPPPAPPVQRRMVEATDSYTSTYNSGATTDLSLAEEEKEVFSRSSTEFVSMVDQLISVEYAIDLPYQIKSDNQLNMVLIRQSSIDASYAYHVVPKLDKNVYLVAEITNIDDLNLLSGNASIFHDGSYLGKTFIDPNTMSDTLNLSLGKANSLKVTRTMIKTETKERIVGDKVEKTMAYRIKIKSHLNRSIALVVEDQVPVSRKEEILVDIQELSKGKLDEVNGFVKWKDKLRSNGEIEYELIYTIKYDKTTSLPQMYF